MARAPNYDFERRERQKAKDAKRAAKADAKGKVGEDKPGEGAEPGTAQPEAADVAGDKTQNG